MCCLGMPIVFLGLFLAIEFDVVKGVWRQSPVFAVIILRYRWNPRAMCSYWRHDTPLAYVAAHRLKFESVDKIPITLIAFPALIGLMSVTA
jgi:hypothetical protein